MVNIAVVEDEEKYRDNLCNMIKTCSADLNVECRMKCFGNGMDFITEYKPHFDLVFLDIEMPLLDGMNTAKKLREIDKDVLIIFITNLAQYAIKGYEVEALDFIVKPIAYNTFLPKYKKAVKVIGERTNNYIALNSDGIMRKVRANDVIFIEVIGHFLYYHLRDETIMQYGTIGEADKQTEPFGFFRIYKSYIVNLARVQKIMKDSIIVESGEELPLSRLRKKEFLAQVADYLGDKYFTTGGSRV